jgi:hypothetical protein
VRIRPFNGLSYSLLLLVRDSYESRTRATLPGGGIHTYKRYNHITKCGLGVFRVMRRRGSRRTKAFTVQVL